MCVLSVHCTVCRQYSSHFTCYNHNIWFLQVTGDLSEHWPDPFSRENCGQSIGLTAGDVILYTCLYNQGDQET